MATIHPKLMEKMKELMDEWREESLNKTDTSPIWRKKISFRYSQSQTLQASVLGNRFGA